MKGPAYWYQALHHRPESGLVRLGSNWTTFPTLLKASLVSNVATLSPRGAILAWVGRGASRSAVVPGVDRVRASYLGSGLSRPTEPLSCPQERSLTLLEQATGVGRGGYRVTHQCTHHGTSTHIDRQGRAQSLWSLVCVVRYQADMTLTPSPGRENGRGWSQPVACR